MASFKRTAFGLEVGTGTDASPTGDSAAVSTRLVMAQLGGAAPGSIVRASGNIAAMLAQANISGNLIGICGVTVDAAALGTRVTVVTQGPCRVLMEAGLTVAAGDPVFVSETVAGRGTNVEPATARQVGVVVDAAGYSRGDLVVVTLAPPGLASSGGGGGAPTDAGYWVSAPHAGLSNEKDVSALPDGALIKNNAGSPAAALLGTDYEAPLTFAGGLTRALNAASIADDGVTNAKLRNSAATSVIGRSANSTGDPADIAATVDGHVLRLAGATLGFGTLAAGAFASDTIPHAALAAVGSSGVLARAADSAGALAFVAASATEGDVLQVQADGSLAWGPQSGSGGSGYDTVENNGTPVVQRSTLNLATTFTATDAASKTLLDLTTAGVALAKLVDLAGLSVLGRSTNSSGVQAAITGTDGQALRVSGTTLGFGTLATAAYADASVTLAKQADLAGLSVPGRAANTTGVMAAITGTDGQVLRVAGTTLGFGTVATAGIANNAVTAAKMQQLAGLSVLGVTGGSTADMAAITGTADQVLRVNGAGNALAFGTVATAGIGANQVTVAKIQQFAGLSVVGVGGSSTADAAAITAGTDGHVLRRSGTALAFGTLAAGAFADGTIVYARLATSGVGVLGRAADSTGALDVISAGSAAEGDVLAVQADGSLAWEPQSGAGGSGYTTIANNGTPVTARATLNLSTEFTATDDGGNAETDFALTTAGVGFSKLASLAGLSVLGRGAGTTGVMAALTATTDQVLRESGGALAFGTVATAGITNNAVTDAKLRQGAGLSVVGVTAGSTANVGDIAAGADGAVLRRASSSSLAFGTLLAASFADNTVVPARLTQQAALTVLGVTGSSTANVAAIAGTADQVLRVNTAGTALAFGTIATAGIAANAVTDAKLRQSAGLSVVGRASSSTGDVADITAGNDAEVLRRNGSTLGFGTLPAGSFADGTIALTRLASQAALSVVANATNGSASPTAVAGTADQVLRVNAAGTALAFGTIATAGIADASVTLAKQADLAGLSVSGRSTNSSGVQAAITGTDGQVLRVSGTTLGFGTVVAAGIASDAVTTAKILDNNVTLAKLATQAALSVLANATNSTAVPSAVAAGTDGHVFRRSGTALAFGTVVTAGLADGAVTFAKAGFRLGEFTASAANDFDIALPTGYQGQDTRVVVVDLEATAASAAFFDILLNGSDTVDSKRMVIVDGASAPADGGANGPGVVSTTERNFIRLILHLRDGDVRLVSTEIIGNFAGTFRRYWGIGRWTDTTTDITSIRLRLDGGVNWTAGSVATVWAF